MVRFLKLTDAAPVDTFARADAILKKAPPSSWHDDSSNFDIPFEFMELLESIEGFVGNILLPGVPEGHLDSPRLEIDFYDLNSDYDYAPNRADAEPEPITYEEDLSYAKFRLNATSRNCLMSQYIQSMVTA